MGTSLCLRSPPPLVRPACAPLNLPARRPLFAHRNPTSAQPHAMQYPPPPPMFFPPAFFPPPPGFALPFPPPPPPLAAGAHADHTPPPLVPPSDLPPAPPPSAPAPPHIARPPPPASAPPSISPLLASDVPTFIPTPPSKSSVKVVPKAVAVPQAVKSFVPSTLKGARHVAPARPRAAAAPPSKGAAVGTEGGSGGASTDDYSTFLVEMESLGAFQ
jgi:hypothetical protein